MLLMIAYGSMCEKYVWYTMHVVCMLEIKKCLPRLLLRYDIDSI